MCGNGVCTADLTGTTDADGGLTKHVDWGDGETTDVRGSVVEHRYDAGGVYRVKLTARDGDGMVDIRTREAVATPDPSARPGGAFRPHSPTRVANTSTGVGVDAGPVPPRGWITVPVAGRADIPDSGVYAAALNVTVDAGADDGYLQVFASGRERPKARSVSFTAGARVSTLVHSNLGSDGAVRIYNGSDRPVHLLVDASGWFTTPEDARTVRGAGRFRGSSPYRAFDSRSRSPLRPREARAVRIAGTGGRAGVPSGPVSAVVLDVTLVRPGRDGYLTVYPADAPRPRTPSVRATAGSVVSNRVVVPVSADGRIRVYNRAGASNVLIDVSGWYTTAGATRGAWFARPPLPTRRLDSRPGDGDRWTSPCRPGRLGR